MIAAGKTVDPTSAAKMAELLALFDRIAEEAAARRRGDTVLSADTHYAPPQVQFRFSSSGDRLVMLPPLHRIYPIPYEDACEEANSGPLFPYLGLTFGILPE